MYYYNEEQKIERNVDKKLMGEISMDKDTNYFDFLDADDIKGQRTAIEDEKNSKIYKEFVMEMNRLWKENNIEQKLIQNGKCILYSVITESKREYKEIVARRRFAGERNMLYRQQINGSTIDLYYGEFYDYVAHLFPINIDLLVEFLQKHKFNAWVTLTVKKKKFPHNLKGFFRFIIIGPIEEYEYALWIGIDGA